jgi:hypothetical protein
MTINAVIRAIRDRDAALVVEGDRLRYLGPRLAPDDPLRLAIAEHRAIILELFTYAPGRRCAAEGCYRLRADDSETCTGPHLVLDTQPAELGADQLVDLGAA